MSGSNTPDPRPRPEYGEYATPEEQRARIQQPNIEATLDGTIAAKAVPLAESDAPVAPAVTDSPVPAAPAALHAARPLDRIFTIALLAIGAVNVFFSVQNFLDLGAVFTRTMAGMGIPGEFTNTSGAQTWGGIATVVLIAGLLLTALAAWRRLRAGRTAWWIPLVGAAVTYVIVIICLMIPLANDPAFQEYVNNFSS